MTEYLKHTPEGMVPAEDEEMTFNDLCAEFQVTPEERIKLAQHLATLRHAATMELAQPPLNCPTCGGSWWKGNPPKCAKCGAVANGVTACADQPSAPQSQPQPEGVEIDYTNWKGERGRRRIEPRRAYFGATQYHPKMQLLLEAMDLAKGEVRTFAVADIHSWNGSLMTFAAAFDSLNLIVSPTPATTSVRWSSVEALTSNTPKPDVTDADLGRRFTKTIGGPNPLYQCNVCQESVLGVRNELVTHITNCKGEG